ncbi:LytTR family DNA-binding domain-containing protein [Solibacillus silvestris]|uniref:LytTR family DNA-binding domain-containing protein n=1 Tax=Solibacillus silvestris TaxID=76853 RepID=UPI003F7DE988
MKVHLHIEADKKDTEVHIYTSEFNPEIEQLMNILKNSPQETLIGYKGADIYVLKIDAVFSVFIEDTKVLVQTDEDEYECKLKLYELAEKYANKFIRINKSTLINIDKIHSLQSKLLNFPQLILTNEVSFNVSRKYLPVLKGKLGLINGGAGK